jgi:hypothetical protein
LWTGPPTEGEDSSLSTSNHTAAGPQARTGVKQVDSVFKTAKNKKDTHRTRTICFIFLHQQKKIKRTLTVPEQFALFFYNSKKKRTLTVLEQFASFFYTAKNKEDSPY